ncbi:signal peptidase I [Candidatus Gottesmanbacteria bacterium]|nr:signal peptidase I [Candidatus Gottesmanbacteria bacterium]
MKYMRSVGKWILFLLNLAKGPAFVVVVGLGLLSLLTSTSLPWQIPLKPFLVTSGSMRPTIPEGSTVFVDRKTTEVKVGDIVTFLRPGNARENVTHRITATETKDNNTLYKTKGDANEAVDIWSVRRESMWGKVVFHIPLLGFVVSFTKTRPGVLLMVVLPLAVIAIDELRVIIREILWMKKKKSKKNSPPVTTITALFLLISYSLFAVAMPTSMAAFSDTTSVTNSQVATSCWIAPVAPTLNFPPDNTNTNATNIVFDWFATTSTCPTATIQYNFQLFSDAGATAIVSASGFSGNLSYLYSTIPEGEYWWRVQAQDQYGSTSNSTANHLIVDRTAPTAALSVTGSGFKAVEERLTNGDFETGSLNGWTTAGTVTRVGTDTLASPRTVTSVAPYEGSSMVRLGSKVASLTTNANYVWENRLMQSFTSGAKSLSFYYNFFTRDTSVADNPGFFVRINGQEVFQVNTLAANPLDLADGSARGTGWQQFFYNLSGIETPQVNLAIYAGNTVDRKIQSWAYVDKITTYFISARGNAEYKITGSDTFGINQCFYEIDGGGYTAIANDTTFQIPSAGTHTLSYYCTDSTGNASAITPSTVITDTDAPSAVSDLAVLATTENTATLTWIAPGNDGSSTGTRASSYNIRFATTPITDDDTFNAATAAPNVPAPQEQGTPETLEILGLEPSTTYYFAVKSYDEAPNTSTISNIASTTTPAGTALNPGDVVINEIMWMGSSASANDEWVELRNMTARTIALDGVYLTRWNGTSDLTMVTIPAGASITPNGYFLISNFAAAASQLKDAVAVDLVNTAVNISNTALSLKLYTSGSILVDSAWNQTAPKEGIFSAALGRYYSMERTSVPGDGTNPLSWYTSIDTASTEDFFDNTADERGTPGAVNRSENEPLSHQIEQERDPITAIEPLQTIQASIAAEIEEPTLAIDSAASPSALFVDEPEPTPEITPIPAPEETPITSSTALPEPSIEPTQEPQPAIVSTSATEPTLEPTSAPEPAAAPIQSTEPAPAPIIDTL